MAAPIINPLGAALRGKATQQFAVTNTVAPVTWTCVGGSITAGGLYTAPNVNGSYTVKATRSATDFWGTAGEQATVAVTVIAGLDYAPGVESSGATKKHVDVSEGVLARRWPVGRGPALRYYDLEFPVRPTAEADEQFAVWQANYPDLPVYFTDPYLLQERKFLFDSKFSRARISRGLWSYKFSLREVKAYQPGEGAPVSSIFPYVPDYGFELEEGKEVFTSDAWDGSRAARALAGTHKPRVELSFYGLGKDTFLGLEANWIYNYPGRAVTFQYAAQTGLAGEWLIDSDLSWQYSQHNMTDCKFIVRRK